MLAASMVFGTLWMVPIAVMPLAIGAAIDSGITGGDTARLLTWIAVVLVLGLVQAVSVGALEYAGTVVWVHSATTMQRAVLRHAALVGAALPAKVRTGDVAR